MNCTRRGDSVLCRECVAGPRAATVSSPPGPPSVSGPLASAGHLPPDLAGLASAGPVVARYPVGRLEGWGLAGGEASHTGGLGEGEPPVTRPLGQAAGGRLLPPASLGRAQGALAGRPGPSCWALERPTAGTDPPIASRMRPLKAVWVLWVPLSKTPQRGCNWGSEPDPGRRGR